MPDSLTPTPTHADPATEAAIQGWLDTLGHVPDTERDELEDHLRSSLPELLGRGLSPDDAVLLAGARLRSAVGMPLTAPAITRTETARHPVLRTLVGVAVCIGAGLVSLLVVMMTLFLLARQGITATEVTITLAVGGTVSALLLLVVVMTARDIHRTTAGRPVTT